jgi:mono/diheme cytochrome c family protein
MNPTPSPRRRVRAAGILAAGALALVAAGCGDSEPDLANGKAQFAACAGCHTLQDAGATGSDDPNNPQAGPNLDDSFRGARQQGFEDSQFEGVVHRWIAKSQPPMPRDLVTGQDARDVAAYVASVAGTSPDSAVVPAQPQPVEPPEPGTLTYETD